MARTPGREGDRGPDRRGGGARTKPTPTEPEPSREPGGAGDPPCQDPPSGNRGGGPGKWRDVNRGDYDSLWKRYQEQISGVKRGKEYRYNDVDYDGFRSEGGRHVFIEAKSIGYSCWLREAVVDSSGNVRSRGHAKVKLDELLRQLRRQLEGVMEHPDARLRYVMAEPDALAKIKAFAKQELPPEEFQRIDWEQVDVDFDFKGCR